MTFRRGGWIGIGLVIALLVGGGVGQLVADWRLRSGLRWAEREVAAGRFGPARRWLAAQSARGASRGEVEYLLGFCERAEGRPAAAVAAWSRVPAGSRLAVAAALARAKALVSDLGRFAEAEEALRPAIRGHDPAAVEARHALFQLLFYQGRGDEMRRLIEDAWPRLPDPAAELRDLWRIDNATADRDAIAAAVARAVRKAPDDDRVRLAQAYLATLAGRYDEAKVHLDACLRRRPDDPAAWRADLNWARATEREDEARRAARHLPADRFTEAEVLDLRAWLAARRADAAAERRALERLIELASDDTRAIGRLAALAIRAGQPERAEQLRRRLAEVSRAKARYRQLLDALGPSRDDAELARLAESLGRRVEAEGWWTLALRRSPADGEARAALRRLRRRPAPPWLTRGLTLANLLDDGARAKPAPPE
jgi:enediyne biosynthesis protein E4